MTETNAYSRPMGQVQMFWRISNQTHSNPDTRPDRFEPTHGCEFREDLLEHRDSRHRLNATLKRARGPWVIASV